MLEAPIVEVLKPKMLPEFLLTPVPENIIPLLELLRVVAQPTTTRIPTRTIGRSQPKMADTTRVWYKA